MHSKLEDEAVRKLLEQMCGWVLCDGKLQKRFSFAGFAEAIGFITAVAVTAEKMNHHPEWSNIFNRVDVALVTHDVGGLTELDFSLARKMDNLASSGGSGR